MYKRQYVDGTIFFGDSIVDNFIFFGSVPRRCVWAKTSLQPAVALDWDINIYTDGTQRKITDALAAFKPERIYINLGANAVNQFTVDYFIEKYEEVLTAMQQASPTTKIIVGSVYPFDARYDNPKVPKPPFGNDKINKMNVRLCELCRKLGIKFLNVAEVMKLSLIHILPMSQTVSIAWRMAFSTCAGVEPKYLPIAGYSSVVT